MKGKPVLFSVFWNDNSWPEIGKTENETGFPFIVQKPVNSAVGSDGSFLFAAYTEKNVLFRT